MYIIIPMAGLGTRFQKAADANPEYRKPKPFISVRGYPMILWATGSLPFIRHTGQTVADEWNDMEVGPEKLIFVILKEHDDAYGLKKGLREIYGQEITVIVLPHVTRGAAETAYQAKQYIDLDGDLIISDSDHYFDGKPLAQRIRDKKNGTAGIIPVFVPPNDGIPRWSYSLTHFGSADIIQVGEKDPELMNKGAFANIGAYYFSKGKIFMDEVERVIADNDLTGDEGKKEFYVAPIYQRLLSRGLSLEAAIIPEVWGLGTPADLEYFLAHCPVHSL